MEVSQVAFALFCAASLVSGAFIGFVYDAFAVLPVIFGKVYSKKLRKKLSRIKEPFKTKTANKKSKLLVLAVFIHDFITALAAGVLLILVVYRFNDGQMRAAAIICFFAGFFAYRAAFSRFVRPISELTGFCIRYLALCITFVIGLPIRAVTYAIQKIARKKKIKRIQNIIDAYTLKTKKDLLFFAEHFGLFEYEELSKHGKKKIKHAGNNGDNRDPAFVGSSHCGEYNAIQSKARRGRKARGGA